MASFKVLIELLLLASKVIVPVFADPVASTSRAIPTYLTPFNQTTPPTHAGTPVNTEFNTSGINWGKLTDWSFAYNIYRDGGGSCSLSNTTFWFFDDTSVYDGRGNLIGFASNSLAVAETYSHPGWLKDITATKPGDFSPAIPFTSAESSVAGSPSKRYALWTYTNCIPVSSTKAVHFWLVNKYSSKSSASTFGNTAAVYQLDPTSNTLSITRNSQLSFNSSTYAYGSFANTVVNGVAYLYAVDNLYGGRYDIHVASVPVVYADDPTKYQYWDNGAQKWSSTVPIPTARRTSAAVISNSYTFSTGTIYYSTYHNSYIMLYMSNWADSAFRVLYAPSPLGPWVKSNKVVYQGIPGPKGYNYGGIAHPNYYQTGNNVQGQKLMLHYSYQDSNGTYPMAYELIFN
ncbi:hypothetical protein V1511DRAFT_523736 [Dipodascopsis uninucleata]